jgi:hypothetical protein
VLVTADFVPQFVDLRGGGVAHMGDYKQQACEPAGLRVS